MNKITLKRLISNSKYTVGCITLNINGQEQIYWTLELPDKDNQRNISCIPKGLYELDHYSSTKFPVALKINGVLNRSGILIHPLNFLEETEGCIGIGFEVTIRNKRRSKIYQKRIAEIRESKNAVESIITYVARNHIKYIEII